MRPCWCASGIQRKRSQDTGGSLDVLKREHCLLLNRPLTLCLSFYRSKLAVANLEDAEIASEFSKLRQVQLKLAYFL